MCFPDYLLRPVTKSINCSRTMYACFHTEEFLFSGLLRQTKSTNYYTARTDTGTGTLFDYFIYSLSVPLETVITLIFMVFGKE